MRTRFIVSASLLLAFAAACGGAGSTTSVDAVGGTSNTGGSDGVGGDGTSGAEGGSGGTSAGGTDGGGGSGGNNADGGTNSGGASTGGVSSGGTGGGLPSGGTGGGTAVDNPTTCAQAASTRTHVGCDFWPTVTFNPVYSEFDFAIVVANPGAQEASIAITGPSAFNWVDTVPAGGATTIKLPWVGALKGPEYSRVNTSGGRVQQSVRADGSAYHVVSSVPVVAWQFNPLQPKKPLGDFSSCGTKFDAQSCYSASNDASLLLPSTSWTGNYSVLARSSMNAGDWGSAASNLAITAKADNTTVTIQYAAECAAGVNSGAGKCTASGTGITAAAPGETQTFSLNAGDVLQLGAAWGADQSGSAGSINADLSGTMVNASNAVQIVSLNPISTVPDATVGNADHFEETLFPAETWGKKYLVAPPTSPSGAVKGGHVVRIYGAVDGTQLTYAEGVPVGAPSSINAGQVVEIGPTTQAFTIEGSQPFAVGSFMVGGQTQGSGSCPSFPCYGDPSFSVVVPTAQFLRSYTFVAPLDYDYNFADVLVPDGASVTLDGSPLAGTKTAIGSSGWSVVRVALGMSTGGVHKVSTSHELGLGVQVMGFAHATSYYYPAGSRLSLLGDDGWAHP